MSYHPARTALRKDANQASVILELKRKGYSVLVLSSGADFVVGKSGMNFIVELKNPAKPKSARALTPTEAEFHANWRGQIMTVTTVEQIEHVIEGKLSIWSRGLLRVLK